MVANYMHHLRHDFYCCIQIECFNISAKKQTTIRQILLSHAHFFDCHACDCNKKNQCLASYRYFFPSLRSFSRAVVYYVNSRYCDGMHHIPFGVYFRFVGKHIVEAIETTILMISSTQLIILFHSSETHRYLYSAMKWHKCGWGKYDYCQRARNTPTNRTAWHVLYPICYFSLFYFCVICRSLFLSHLESVVYKQNLLQSTSQLLQFYISIVKASQAIGHIMLSISKLLDIGQYNYKLYVWTFRNYIWTTILVIR